MNRENWKKDHKMETLMGSLLRIGVFSAAVVVIFGAILFFFQHPHEIFTYKTFKGEPSRLRHVHEIIRQALLLRGRGVIEAGILLLIATPVARVLFSLVAFIIEKDKVYVVITLIVFMILMYSLFGG